MQILELLADGVRGFSPGARVTTPPGYVVLTPSSLVPVPLAGLLSALLFPDGRGAEVAYQAPGQRGTVTLFFQGNDQGTYRLLRELGGAGVLHRVQPKTNQSELITDDSLEMAEFLRSNAGLPAKKTFDQAFALTALQFPTKRPRAKQSGPGAPGKAPTSLPAAQAVQPASDVHAARARLLELKKELNLAQEIERIQDRLDAIAAERTELEAKLQQAASLRAELQEAEAAFAGAPSPESLKLPADIAARAQRFPQLVAKRDEALAKLEVGPDSGFAPHIEPLKSNLRFWAAAMGGAALFTGALISKGAGRYLALLDIPAFGFAALLALRYVDDLQRAQRQGRRGERMATREKKILDDFEAEAQSVKKAMAVLKVDQPSDVAAVFEQKPQLLQRAQQLRSRFDSLQKDPAHVALQGKDLQLKKEQQVLEAKMSQKGGYLREAREIERDIDRMTRSIEAATTSQPAPAPHVPLAPSAPASPQSFEDPVPGFLAIAADLLMTDLAGASGILRERLVQYLGALTDRRYTGIELGSTGRATLQAGSRRVAAAELPPKDLDTLYLACRLTLIERCAGRTKMPVIIEDLLTIVDPAKVALLGKMFKQLAALSQVLHVTTNRDFPAMADSVVKV